MATKKKAVPRKARKAAPRRQKKAAPRRVAKKPRVAGIIRGMHMMFYSSQADALRKFLRDTMKLPATDVGEGWLIFNAPEADVGVHPNEGGEPPSGTADISFYCDDLAASVAQLKARGVEFTQEIEDHGYGLVARFKVPGGFDVQIYQPKYRK